MIAPTTKKMRAVDLPHCNLSQFLEKRLYERLDLAYEELAVKRGVRLDEVAKCPPIFLRQVSCYDKNHTVREGVAERYKSKNYPLEFPCRTKCLILFQNIDGQDVILFGMYVYEYGDKCPQPNQRRVYISYLDSVHYFRPKEYRTIVYHEILVSYLEYVKVRGFHTAHIWACPPQKGDDYILYVHPPDQKTPRADKLKNWYQDMLNVCQARGIVSEIVDIHTEYLADHSNDATCLPYFEGDYWVNEAEVIIKDLGAQPSDVDAAGVDDIDSSGYKSKRKSKTRPNRSGKGAVTTGKSERDPLMAKLASIIEPMKDTFFVARLRHEESLAARAICCSGLALSNAKPGSSTDEDSKAALANAENGGSLDSIKTESNGDAQHFTVPSIGVSMDIAESKQDDIAAADSALEMAEPVESADSKDLGHSRKRKADDLNGEDEQDEAGDDNESDAESNNDFQSAAAAIASGDDSAVDVSNAFANDGDGSADAGLRASPDNEAGQQVEGTTEMDENGDQDDFANAAATVSAQEQTTDATSTAMVTGSPMSSADGNVDSSAVPSTAVVEQSTTVMDSGDGTISAMVSAGSTEESAAPDAAVTDDAVATVPTTSILSKPISERFCKVPIETDDTEDVDDIQESEHFDTRQSFLNLCQGNHYQFDQLRRAKYTSMMVLYHIHNPDAPKFVPSCNNCHKDILQGHRFRCETCDVDFCQSCYDLVGPMRIHQHALRPMAIGSSSQPQQLTEEQRRERQRSIQLHMQLLQHAANCVKECQSRNCAKMKVPYLSFSPLMWSRSILSNRSTLINHQDFLRHDQSCQIKTKNGCRLCSRIHNLLQLHARQCRIDNCRVPRCHEIKEQLRFVA